MADRIPTARNLLLLSGGSKVAIARIAQKAARKRGIELHISDTRANVPSKTVADQFTVLPKHSETTWNSALIELCKTNKIGLILPTRHSELPALDKIKSNLEEIGTRVSLSSANTLNICIHKINTFSFLEKIGVPTPPTCLRSAFRNQIDFPLVAKPEDGASSEGIVIVHSEADLMDIPGNWILQKKATGKEFTTNLYLNRSGEVRCAIPHLRIAVEAGEVVQARTRRHGTLIALCSKLAQALPGAEGILNMQAFVDEAADTISVIEINPRIGGGYPLCDAAKGTYIEWLCQEHLDHLDPAPFAAWTEELLMMRYREAVFSL